MRASPTWMGDIWGGLAAMLVALPSSVAFGMLVYTPLGPEYAGQGAMTGLLGAAALGIVAPLCGRNGALISAPCAPAAAVLSTLTVGLMAGTYGARVDPSDALTLVGLTALLSAALQVAFGAIGGGSLIKFIPYQVVSGYLSGVGLLIALGQLPKLFGLPKDARLLSGLLSPALWKWEGLAVGGVTIVAMAVAPYVTRTVPAAIMGLFAGIASYFALSALSPHLLVLRGNPLIIGPIQTDSSFLDHVSTRIASVAKLDLATLSRIIVPAATLSVLLSIDTLKTCVGVDAVNRRRHDSNRELVGQGIGNLASFVAGGMPGAGTMGATMVNLTSGGRTPRSGVIEGVFVVLSLLLLSDLIAWVPVGALAGILLVIAWRMLDVSMFRLLRYPAGRMDFLVIAGVIVVALTMDLIVASGVGIGLAILLFIRDQVRGSVIRSKRYLNQVSSKTRREPNERDVLTRLGDQAVLCELQGNIFFGTTDQLLTQLERDLRIARFLLLDFRRVQSIDFTAVHLFEQMHGRLAERNGRLLFSGMPSSVIEARDFERYFSQMGLMRRASGVLICETQDGAMEWMEERLLESAGLPPSAERHPLELRELRLFQALSDPQLASLGAVIGRRSLRQGELAFAQGDGGDELFLVRQGGVRVLLPLEGGKRHHVATIERGGFFGELSFLDQGTRSADVEAKVDTDLYVLSRARFDEQARTDANLGVIVFSSLALAMAERLRHTDAELQAVEDR